jgi:hypothetical protein
MLRSPFSATFGEKNGGFSRKTNMFSAEVADFAKLIFFKSSSWSQSYDVRQRLRSKKLQPIA